MKKSRALMLFGVIVFAFMVSTCVVWASPAIHGPIEKLQPDGTKITIFLKGDEFLHWFEDKDGRAVVKKDDGYFCYASGWSEDGLVPTVIVVGKASMEDLKNIPVRPMPKPGMLKSKMENHLNRMARGWDTSNPEPKVLLLNVSWQGTTISESKMTASQAVDMWFASNGTSAKSYYLEATLNNVNINAAQESEGITNDGVVDISLSGSHPGDDDDAFLQPALEQASQWVDFAQFDTNGDGNLTPDELCVVFIAHGGEQATGDDISHSVWAHASWGGTPVMVDGVGISYYAVFGAYQFLDSTNSNPIYQPHLATVGVQVHELGHLAFTFDDVYDYGSNNSVQPNFNSPAVGYWSLMAKNWTRKNSGEFPGATPPLIDAWNITAKSGIMTARTITNQTGVAIVAGTEDAIVKVPSTVSSMYFLVQLRVNQGFDRGAFFSIEDSDPSNTTGGLMIYRIDEDAPGIGGAINDDENRRYVLVEEAHGGVQHLEVVNGDNYGDTLDLFYDGNNASFTATSDPNSNLFGGIASSVSITNISAPGQTMLCDIYTSGTPVTPTPTEAITPTPTRSVTPTPGGSSSGGGGCSAVEGVSFMMLLIPCLCIVLRK